LRVRLRDGDVNTDTLFLIKDSKVYSYAFFVISEVFRTGGRESLLFR